MSALGDIVTPPSAADAPFVAVVTAGTSDIPVAEEAALTPEFLGHRASRLRRRRGRHPPADAPAGRAAPGAGGHRVAGMEGALASVVGGLVACPVIAVPTSVGYGASFGGLAPAGDAEHLRAGRGGGEHRQRLRRRGACASDHAGARGDT